MKHIFYNAMKNENDDSMMEHLIDNPSIKSFTQQAGWTPAHVLVYAIKPNQSDRDSRQVYSHGYKKLFTKLQHHLWTFSNAGNLPIHLACQINNYIALQIIVDIILASNDLPTLQTMLNPVPLGIVLGLFFGKQIGVFALSYISVKLKLAVMPNNSSWPAFYAVSILTGIGFTMSLFVGNLAFANNMEYMDGVKIGVLTQMSM